MQQRYWHTCNVCGAQFQSTKRTRRTCGWSCRGKLAGTAPPKMICECGRPASKRGYCPACSLERKRASRRAFYQRHRQEILRERKLSYAADPQRTWQQTERNRFNGLRRDRLRMDGYACTRCGRTTTLIVHHINRRSRNIVDRVSTLTELRTLCRSCHMIEHSEEIANARRATYLASRAQDQV